MKALLDTQVFLWMAADPEALSTDARDAIEAPGAELYLSAAAVWEISIKSALGKLTLPETVATYVRDRLHRLELIPLPISLTHAIEVAGLPPHHRDPFDRMLVAQARSERMVLISADRQLAAYEVEILPA
jgi:PIN domain nuclease of toxin-antitoxin system